MRFVKGRRRRGDGRQNPATEGHVVPLSAKMVGLRLQPAPRGAVVERVTAHWGRGPAGVGVDEPGARRPPTCC